MNKHKTKSCIQLIISFLIMFMLVSTANPLQVHAAETIVDADTVADVPLSSSSSKWYGTYAIGSGYKGQGVLIYLLERNGGGPVAGTTPKAYPCSATVAGYELHAQDKYNRYGEVTTWEPTLVHWAGSVPNGGGLIKKSTSSNMPAIKAWLKTVHDGNSTQGIRMVQDVWGPSIAQRFTNEEIILIVEPIVANQFSQYFVSPLLNITSDMSFSTMVSQLNTFKTLVDNTATTGLSPDLKDFIATVNAVNNIMNGGSMPPSVQTQYANQILQQFGNNRINTNIYVKLGDVYAGTSKKVAEYYQSLTAGMEGVSANWHKADSGKNYYRKGANIASLVKDNSVVCANANFTLWPSSKSDAETRICHDDATINTYSLGMLAMLAFSDDGGQTTCDEPLIPTPHDPPNESQGNTTIIKSYRTRNTTTNTLTDDGTFTRSNLSNQITIEDEAEYKVIAWKSSTNSKPSTLNSLTWETAVPQVIGDQGTSATSVTLPTYQKYLYVLLEKGTGTPPSTTNYTLTQSTMEI